MTLPLEATAAITLVLVAPLAVWAERRVKAWTQLRRGPGPLQIYRDLRRAWIKQPMRPENASPLWTAAPTLALAVILVALLILPLWSAEGGLSNETGLLVLGLLLVLHRAILAAQAYDTATSFGGLGASRELFLGGLSEPVFILGAAAVFLQTGSAGLPAEPLEAALPATWLLLAALAFLWLAENARIPFDNPATHLELTMVHEAMILESSGWTLALHELGAMVKQVVTTVLLVVLFVPLPADGPVRVAILAASLVAASAAFALVESAMAKVRLFRASHLLIMAALLTFLASAFSFVAGGLA